MSLRIFVKYQISTKKYRQFVVDGIALIPILQNIGQLNNRYPNGLADEILGNTDIKLNLGTTDTLTAMYFCKLLGVATAETQSISKEVGIDGELEFGRKNISTLERNLMNPDEIVRISCFVLMAIFRGHKPLLLKKIIYTEHPLAKKLQDVSVLTYIPDWNNNIEVPKTIEKKEKKVVTKQNKIKKSKNMKILHLITFKF